VSDFAAEVKRLRARYPHDRSAVMGALRLAQERHGGWLPPGEVTLRLIECAGGCGYAPVVVVDGRYREPVKPDDVPALVEELHAG
jgi:NADH:ubiquinone oxidoreductase subunit E